MKKEKLIHTYTMVTWSADIYTTLSFVFQPRKTNIYPHCTSTMGVQFTNCYVSDDSALNHDVAIINSLNNYFYYSIQVTTLIDFRFICSLLIFLIVRPLLLFCYI